LPRTRPPPTTLSRSPVGTTAVVVAAYEAHYPHPIAIRKGDGLVPDHERTRKTDFIGWTWCRGPDGREGWGPEAWRNRGLGAWTMRCDFTAVESTVRKGDRIRLAFRESGFVFGRTDEERDGWLPAAVLKVDA